MRDPREIERAFRAATDAHAGAVLDLATGVTFARARQVVELAARSRLPVMYDLRAYVEAGGLIAYGADIGEIWRRGAGFVTKILKGAKPGNLLTQSLLVRADQVIE